MQGRGEIFQVIFEGEIVDKIIAQFLPVITIH